MREYTVLVSFFPSGHKRGFPRPKTCWSAEERLNELEQLAKTAGAEVATRVSIKRKKIDPSFYIGRGKATETAKLASKTDSNLIIFDVDLSPAQQRNLEEIFQI